MDIISKLLISILSFSALSLFTSCGKDKVKGGKSSVSQGQFESGPPLPQRAKIRIESVDTSLPEGYYNAGDIIDIQLRFSGPVKAQNSSSIQLILNHYTEVNAQYKQGSGTNTLTYTYQVTLKDRSDGIRLSGKINGQIKTVTGQDFNLILPAAGSKHSLSGKKLIKLGITDTFDNGNISSQWTLNDMDNFNADDTGSNDDDYKSSFQESDGFFVLSAAGRRLWRKRHEYVSAYLDNYSGNFDFSIKVVNKPKSRGWSKAGLLIANNHKDLTQGGVFICALTQSKKIVVQWAKRSNGVINRSVKDGTSNQPVWLRVKRAGNMMACFYRYDESSDWKLHAAGWRDIDAYNAADVGFFTNSYKCKKPISVQFDDFNSLKEL